MKYKVRIEEVLCKTIELEADNVSDAESKVRKLYRECEIVLGAEDFVGEPTIECIE